MVLAMMNTEITTSMTMRISRNGSSHVPHHHKAIGNLQGGLHIGDAIDLLHLVCRILQLLNVLDMDAVTVPQGLGGQVFSKSSAVSRWADEVLQGLLFGHKGHRGHIGDRFDLILQGSGLVLG